MEAYVGHFKGSTAPMVDLGTYIFKDLNLGKSNLKNHLRKLTLKKFMSQNMCVLPLNIYVYYQIPNTKRKIYIKLWKLNLNI